MIKNTQDEEGYCLIIFVDEKTHMEFVKKMVNYLIEKYKDKKTVKVIYKNLQNAVNYNMSVNIYQNEVLKRFINQENLNFKIICFHDIYKSPYKIKPYVNWDKIKQELSTQSKIIHIYDMKVRNSIEDWILLDMKGLCKYLDINENISFEDLIGNTGEEKVKNLFLKHSNIYQKGYTISKFINYLDFELLYNRLVNELKILRECLFIK